MNVHRKVLLIPMSALLPACGQTTIRINLTPAANECQLTEQRSFLMTAGITVCWNEEGQVIGMGVTSGKPIAGVVGDTAMTLGIAGAGMAIGSGISGVADIEITVP